jgi:hypothetical protein
VGILLGFLPFLAFAVLSLSTGALAALMIGAAVSAGLIIRNHVRGGSLKILEAGTFLLFAGLVVYTVSAGQTLSIIAVRLCVGLGLFGIVLASIIVRHPFTLQYAKEQVTAEHWANPLFIRANYKISAAWAVAFLIMVIAETAMLAVPGFPTLLGSVVIVAALLGAVLFTRWRVETGRRRTSLESSD